MGTFEPWASANTVADKSKQTLNENGLQPTHRVGTWFLVFRARNGIAVVKCVDRKNRHQSKRQGKHTASLLCHLPLPHFPLAGIVHPSNHVLAGARRRKVAGLRTLVVAPEMSNLWNQSLPGIT